MMKILCGWSRDQGRSACLVGFPKGNFVKVKVFFIFANLTLLPPLFWAKFSEHIC